MLKDLDLFKSYEELLNVDDTTMKGTSLVLDYEEDKAEHCTEGLNFCQFCHVPVVASEELRYSECLHVVHLACAQQQNHWNKKRHVRICFEACLPQIGRVILTQTHSEPLQVVKCPTCGDRLNYSVKPYLTAHAWSKQGDIDKWTGIEAEEWVEEPSVVFLSDGNTAQLTDGMKAEMSKKKLDPQPRLIWKLT